VAGGLVDPVTSFNTFEAILGNATTLPTGYVRDEIPKLMSLLMCILSFIVLQHDLYEVTVDLAVGYTMNAALTHKPPFSVSARRW
jgi:hypothetical protein